MILVKKVTWGEAICFGKRDPSLRPLRCLGLKLEVTGSSPQSSVPKIAKDPLVGRVELGDIIESGGYLGFGLGEGLLGGEGDSCCRV